MDEGLADLLDVAVEGIQLSGSGLNLSIGSRSVDPKVSLSFLYKKQPKFYRVIQLILGRSRSPISTKRFI